MYPLMQMLLIELGCVCVCGEEIKGNSVFSVHFFCEAETAF